VSNPLVLPTVYNHFVVVQDQIPTETGIKLQAQFCRRETPIIDKKSGVTDYSNFKAKALTPIVKSIMDFENNQVITQIPKYARPYRDTLDLTANSLGYLEIIDLKENLARYLQIPRDLKSDSRHATWNAYSHLNVTNEAEFLFSLSPTKKGILYTLDFYGNLSEWEIGKMNLTRSLDEWQKLVMNRESEKLGVEVFNASPNTELREFKGPKHGKIDKNNAPHHGGNTWAGKKTQAERNL